MWTINELIVISDLHLAPERNTGSFQSDLLLADFLNWVLAETHDCMIVLAGDVFDLLTVSDCPAQNRFERLSCHVKQIIEQHPEVFDGLTALAQSPHHTLVIMTGEGDAEMMIPELRERIERRLGFSSPNRLPRWLVSGEALCVQMGPAVILIEHGNALDPWNRIDHGSLQAVLSLTSRNLPAPLEDQKPLGGELISLVVSRMREKYSWLSYLRPTNESLLPLLWPLASKSQQTDILRLVERYESMKIEAALKKLSNSPDPIVLYQGAPEADRSSQDQLFKEWVDAIYEQRNEKTSNNGNLIEKVRLLSNHDSFFKLDEPNDTTKYLQPQFDYGADLIIHGHTHAARICPSQSGLYLNTGTWGQLLRLPKSNESKSTWEVFLEQLRTNRVESFALPTFAHVYKHGPLAWPTGALVQWQSGGPETLAAHQLPDSLSHKEIGKWTS